jgi:cyclic pyranopterin phosphate synthase
MKKLSHINRRGKAQMVDISTKQVTSREAVASCQVQLKPDTIRLIRQNQIAKGEVLNTARIAGISAAKRTFELIPLTHPIPIDQVQIDLETEKSSVKIFCRVKTESRTGAEMEALVGAVMAALTVYDMVKAVERGAQISHLHLEYKSGGKSGTWKRKK